MKVNARWRKLFIPILEHGNQTATVQEDKLLLAKSFFEEIMGAAEQDKTSLDFSCLGLARARSSFL